MRLKLPAIIIFYAIRLSAPINFYKIFVCWERKRQQER